MTWPMWALTQIIMPLRNLEMEGLQMRWTERSCVAEQQGNSMLPQS